MEDSEESSHWGDVSFLCSSTRGKTLFVVLSLAVCLASRRNDPRVKKEMGEDFQRERWWGGYERSDSARVKLRLKGTDTRPKKTRKNGHF